MSTETKAALGPWKYFEQPVERATYGCRFAVDSRDESICEVIGTDSHAEDLARLIAAAPEMLKALEALIYVTDQGREGGLILSRADQKPLTNGDQDVIDRAYIKADIALRKAKGESL